MTERSINTPDGVFKMLPLAEYMQRVGTIEKALDDCRIYVQMPSGRHWRVRRNGATKHWKRDPNRFRIPYKTGIRGYGALENDNLNGFWVVID